MKKIILYILLFSIAFNGISYAQNLTKGEAIMKISAADFIKKKIRDLYSWAVGYDLSKVNRIKLLPIINFIKAFPRQVPPDGRTILEIVASVDDPEGLSNIRGVRADLSKIGRLPNMMLVDTGLYGDEKSGDGVFTMQASVRQDIPLGDKEIQVAASNKKGWLALSKTTIVIAKNPEILEAYPEKLRIKRGDTLTLVVRVDNPGRLEDVKNVSIDLSTLGLDPKYPLRKKEAGIYFGRIRIPETVSTGMKTLPISVTNQVGGTAFSEILFEVI